eukprot:maker-scaffold253_size237113-snap-gene-1.30 protein:Tk00293 transcript:maker-scaffold253_size237113-snap-gene-1.30-mRNA-1 annotation:"calcitonin gene-related peptide 2-like"
MRSDPMKGRKKRAKERKVDSARIEMRALVGKDSRDAEVIKSPFYPAYKRHPSEAMSRHGSDLQD